MTDTPASTPPTSPSPLMQRVRHHATLGAYIQPETLDFPCHNSTLNDTHLGFSPLKFPYFDGTIAKHYTNPALISAQSSDHAQLRPLRRNLAVLRNHLLVHYTDQFALNAESTQHYMHLIAVTIGDALKRGSSLIRNPFELSLPLKDVNVLGHGGITIYQCLQQLQQPQKKPHVLATALSNESLLTFLPLALTPFGKLTPSEAPKDTKQRTEENAISVQAAIAQGMDASALTQQEHKDNANDIAALSDEILAVRKESTLTTRSVEELDDKTKSRAIELGREILRKLKLHFADVTVDDLMKAHPDDVRGIMGDVKKVTDLFRHYLDQIGYQQRDLLDNPDVVAALQTTGKMAAIAKLYAMQEAEASGDKTLAERLTKEYEKMPAEWRNTAGTKLGELLENLDKGLKTLQSRLLDQTSNLPDNDQLKDKGESQSQSTAAPSMTQAQAAAQQAEQTRVQMEMLQQEEYRRMLAERRKANNQATGLMGAAPAQQQAQQQAAGQTINQTALDTPRNAANQSGRRNAAQVQARFERRQAMRQQQQQQAQQQTDEQRRAQEQRRADRRERRAARAANEQQQQQQTATDTRSTSTQSQPPVRRSERTQTVPQAPATQAQAPMVASPTHKDFGNLLGGQDIQSMRGSLNATTSGQLIEANSAKKVVEDKLREGSQARNSTNPTTNTPPPPPKRPEQTIAQEPTPDPNTPANKRGFAR